MYMDDARENLKRKKKNLSNRALQKNLNMLNTITKGKNVFNLKKIKNQIEETPNVPVNVPPEENQTKSTANRNSLEVFTKSLTKDERMAFMIQLEDGVPLSKVKNNVSVYMRRKEMTRIQNKIKEVSPYLTALGLTPRERNMFIQRMVTMNQPVDTVKKEAETYFSRKYKQMRTEFGGKLRRRLRRMDPKLEPSNIAHIMNKYSKTFILPKNLLKEARTISESRNHERWVETNSEFLNYMNQLTLNINNRTKFVNALDKEAANFDVLMKSVTEKSIKTANAPRVKERDEIVKYINNAGLNEHPKTAFLKRFDTTISNLNTVKREVNQFKMFKNMEARTKKEMEFVTFLKPLKFLSPVDKMKLFNMFRTKGEEAFENATDLNNVRMDQAVDGFKRYIRTVLKLDPNTDEIQTLLGKYGEYPQYLKRYMNMLQRIKTLTELKKRIEFRAKQLGIHDVFSEKIEKIKNETTAKKVNDDMTKYARDEMKKQVSNMVLESELNTLDVNLNTIKSKENVETMKRRIKEEIEKKKRSNFTTLEEAIKNSKLNTNNERTLLDKFTRESPYLENMMKEVSNLKNQRAKEKYNTEREDLRTYMKENKEDNKRAVLNQFNITKNLNSAKVLANTRREMRTKEKIAKNRSNLKREVQSKNLTNVNRQTILQNFNANPNVPFTFENRIQMIKNKRKEERSELNAYTNLNNKGIVLEQFNKMKNLKSAKALANTLRATRAKEKIATNRSNLKKSLRTMNITNASRLAILQNFNKKPGDPSSFEAKARALVAGRNVAKRGRERQELASYLQLLTLSRDEMKLFLDAFNRNPEMTLNRTKANASTFSKRKNTQQLTGIVRSIAMKPDPVVNNKKPDPVVNNKKPDPVVKNKKPDPVMNMNNKERARQIAKKAINRV